MRKGLYLVIVSTAILFLAACGTVSESSDTQGSSENDERTLNISLGADMLTWDIHNHTTTTTESVHINVFDYLVMRDWENDGEYVPHIATNWEQIDDETWEFDLRDDVTFHNGDQLTAEDVKFTFERVANDSSLKSYGHYNKIDHVEVVDDYKIKIVTDGPDPMLLSRISRQASGILPKDYVEENGMDHFMENPIGSGPLKYESWSRDSEVVLVPNEDYFGEKVTDWDKVVFKAITENSTRVSELLTGGLDIAANVPSSDWERLSGEDGIELVNGDSNRTYLLFLRTEEGTPLADENVRKAIDYAIDDQALVEQLLGGAGTPTLTRVNPGNFGFNEELYNDYRYDVDKAKQLLEEAGYSDGLTLEFMGPQGRYLQDREVLQLIAGMLAEVGITVNTNILEYSVFSDNRATADFEDGYLIALGASFFDAGQSLAYYSPETTSHIYGYENEEINELLLEAESVMDEDIRNENYKRVQEIAAEELPFIVLFQLDQFFGVNDSIEFNTRLDEVVYVPELQKK
jgi:peptide/nickel transport system substrate-binding protein